MSALQIDGVGPVLHINYDFILSLIRLLLRDFRLVPAQIRVNQLINANMISFGLFLATQTSLLLLRCFVFADRKLARKNRAELKANFGRILIHYMRNRSQTACAIFSHLQLDACRPIRERYKNHAPEEKGKFGGEFVPCSDHWIWRGQWTGTPNRNRIKTEYLICSEKMPLAWSNWKKENYYREALRSSVKTEEENSHRPSRLHVLRVFCVNESVVMDAWAI